MENKTLISAIHLACIFSDDTDIPSRLKPPSGKKKKKNKEINPESAIEIRFQEIVDSWRSLISSLVANLGPDKAFRLTSLTPMEQQSISKITESYEFMFFNEYLIKRRDIDKCSDEELGLLSLLIYEFQKKVQEQLTKPD